MQSTTPTTPVQSVSALPFKTPWFYGWNIVAASVLCNMLTTGFYWQGFQVFFLPLLAEFGWSRALFSLAFSFRSVETGIGAPVVGLLVDRFGPRTVLIASGMLVAAGMFLVGFTFDIITFYVFFFMASMGASGTSHSISWAVVIARWFKRKRGRALGIGVSGPTLAGLVLLALERSIEAYGWRMTIWGAGALLLVVLVPVAWLVVRNTPEEVGLLPDGDPAADSPAGVAAAAATTHRPSHHARRPGDNENYSVKQALRTRNFWFVVIIFSCIFFGHSGIQVHQIAFFQNDVGLSTFESTLLLSVVFFISAIGRIGGGVVTDYVEVHWVLAGIVVMNVTAWVYVNFAPISDFWTALPFALLYGVPFGATVSIRPLLMARLFGPQAMGSLVGLFQTAVLAATIAGPVFMGYVYDVAETYRPALMVFIVSSGLALPFVLSVRAKPVPVAAAAA